MKRVLSNQYNIFHIHTSYWTGFLLEELAKQAGIKKVIVHAHASFVDEADPQKRKPLLERHEEIKRDFPPDLATDFWACSQLAADWLFGAQIPKSKIRIMKNAIEVERFRFDEARREALRHELGLDGALVLGTAGRFAYSKNYDFLLDVFAGFYRKNPRARLLLLGDGELREDLERQIRENRLEDAVLLLGWRTNMEAYFQAMDLFLLPSRFEGLGIAAVEAVASGLPCIVSDIRGNRELIADQMRFQPGRTKEMQRILDEVIRNPQLLMHLGDRNQEQIKKYDVQKVNCKMKKIYDSIRVSASYGRTKA